MISTVLKFVRENKLLLGITLGVTFDFSVNLSLNGTLSFDFKILVFVYFGYQIYKQITNKR